MSADNRTLDNTLADEIRVDIADRYFSFRKQIEADQLEFSEKIHFESFLLEKRISFDLVRLYCLLKDENLIHTFLNLTGIEEKLFFDAYICSSPTIRARVFQGIKKRGITRFRRYRYLLIDCYERLEIHVALYRRKLDQLQDEKEVINAEISQFYRENDLSAILGFFRSLGSSSNTKGSMAGALETGIADELSGTLSIAPLKSMGHYLPILPKLPPLTTIKKNIHGLAEAAWERLTDKDRDFFTVGEFPPAERN